MLTKKQSKAFHSILSGLKFSRYGGKTIRFLTLTTSALAYDTKNYDGFKTLNADFDIFKKRVKRTSPYKLYKSGYITKNKLTSKYREQGLFKNFSFEYFKVETNEGHGVLHILYRGSYLPYNYLSDNWNDIHNSWDVNICIINTSDDKKASGYVVTQYMSNQKSSYIRSSHSWNWVFRGFKTLWRTMSYWYKDKSIKLWNNILLARANVTFYSQPSLSDYG